MINDIVLKASVFQEFLTGKWKSQQSIKHEEEQEQEIERTNSYRNN